MNEEAGRLPLQFPRAGSSRMFGDDRLARLAAKGDQRAFAAIYRRHHQELYRYCQGILHDPDDAQDALQATMVKAMRSLPGETREIALKPWLFRVAHNEAINLLRSRTPTSELDPEQVAASAGPEQEAATRERLRELVRDLDQLPARQRSTLVMRELNGLSFEEIGATFALSSAAAKQSVYEARVSLQEMSEGREMECDRVREAISAEDRRVLRSRRMRAHLRGCSGCRGFEAAIGRRRVDLAALAPPLALPAALATLQAVFAGGAGSTPAAGVGAAAGGAAATASGVGFDGIGAGLGGSVALKSAIALLATAAIAGGAAGITGVVDLNGSGSDASHAVKSGRPPAAQPRSDSDGRAAPGGEAGQSSRSSGAAGGADDSSGHRAAHGHGRATAPGQSGTAPGQSGTAPGQSYSSSGGSSASATGQSHSSSAGSQASSTGSQGGGTATAPGQTGTSPGQSGSAGNSGSAPGHVK